MASDDEVFDGASYDASSAVTGPRRSTFTPPPAAVPPQGSEAASVPDEPVNRAAEVDDDELANALAADLGRLAPPLPSSVQDSPLAAPQPAPPAVVAASEPEPVVPPEPVAHPEPAVPTPTVAPVAPAAPTPAWASAPAPDPSQAAPTPQRPVRRSLPDSDLEAILEEAQGAGTLGALDQLEAQMALRETEVREFRAWEATMLAMGTPDAAQAVEEARSEFAGVLPRSTPPRHADVPPVVPTPFAAPEPLVPSAPVAAPSPTVEPTPVAEPAPAVEPAMADDPPRAEPEPEPEPDLPSWDIPAPSATWSPDPEPDFRTPEPVDLVEPESSLEPVPELEPELEPEPEPEPEPDPEPEPEPVSPFAPTAPAADDLIADEPPPLIEPPRFGSAPSAFPEASASLEDVVEAELIDDDGAEPANEPLIEPAPSPQPSAESFSFDDLLAGAPSTEPQDDELPFRDEPPMPSSAEAIFIEPLPVSADDGVPTDTGSIPVIDQAYIEDDLDDDVDETDRVGGPGMTGPIVITAAGVATASVPLAPPSGPIPTMRIPEDEVVLIDNEPVRQRVFSIEGAGLEPTPAEHRIGRAARLFWLWFAANSSIVSIGLGAVVFTVGMSLRQSIVAILAGVALSFFPLGLTTLAGKRSGQPTMVVSRATFGVVGNVVPALIALLTRVFWGAVLLWLIGSSVALVLVGAGLPGPFGDRQLVLIALGATILLAVFIAFAGYPLIARLQLILSILSMALIAGLIVMTWPLINLGTALSTPDGSWILTITGAVLVFSFVGLVWANSGADLARYQRVASSGAASMFGATFGATVPAFILIAYGALLAASNPQLAESFGQSPLETLSRVLPLWYPVPLIAAAVLSLLSGVIVTLYSGGFALKTLGVQVSRPWSVVIIALPVVALAMLFAFGITEGLASLFRDAATTLAVPTAAWAGIFAAEMMIRNRRFESESLLRRGGVYGDVRWGNLIGLLVITGIGFGLTSATVGWLSWQGYLFQVLGVPLDGDLAGTDLGVLVALGLGILLPIVAGIPAIRRQEAARV